MRNWLIAAVMCGMVQQAFAETVRSVSQQGFTWYFAEPATVGTYANGDYWVVGPVVIDSITPHFNGESYGWEINPISQGGQGFARDCGQFDPTLVPALPYTAQPGQSIVKTAPNPESRPCLKTAAVLTVVNTVPPDNGVKVFRPPYAGSEKANYSTTSLRTDLLPSYVAAGDPDLLSVIVARFSRLQLDHKEGNLGRMLHPADNMPDFGSDLGHRNVEAALRLMLADDIKDKLPALIAYVQYGIDLYHIMKMDVIWNDGAGPRPGQKLPIAFAAVLLNDQNMQQALKLADFFNEDIGVWPGKNGVVLYGFERNRGSSLEREYWQSMVSTVAGDNKGYLAYRDPYGYIDGGPVPGSFDQSCCISQIWKGEAVCCALMPQLRTVWNDSLMAAYVNRWIEVGAWTQPDPCAPAESSMDGYGIRFGADPANPGDCIRDTDPSNGIGRYPNLHGTQTDGGFRHSPFVDAMWEEYRSDVTQTNRQYTNNFIGGNPRVSMSTAGLVSFDFGRWQPETAQITLYDVLGRMILSKQLVVTAQRFTWMIPRSGNAVKAGKVYVMSIRFEGREMRYPLTALR